MREPQRSVRQERTTPSVPWIVDIVRSSAVHGYVGRLGLVFALSLVARPADAFIFSEHARITEEAMASLVADGGAEGRSSSAYLGMSATRSTETRDGSLGFFLAFSASSRSFP